MRISFQYIFIAALFFIACSFLFSCDKVNVNFGNASQISDPNVSYFQNPQINLQTLQIDSFLTSSGSANTFLVGYHKDPVFGIIHASSYVQLQLPSSNPIYNQNVTFDSLELILKPKGLFYGDTSKPFTFKIYQLTQLIQNFTTNNNSYFNTTNFAYNPTPIGGQSFTIYPGNSSNIGIRMSDTLGLDLLNKFQTDSQAIKDQTSFLNYFYGLYIDADSTSTNSIYNFDASSDTLIMRLYYNLNGISVVGKYLSFGFVPTKQFNHISHNHTGTSLSSFPPFVNNSAVLSSTLTGDKAYLNSSTGTCIRISFPDLLNLKIAYPYIQVLSAQLVIPPSPGTHNYPYQLPPSLSLYQTDNNNDVLSIITNSAGSAETGNLFIDDLYDQTTKYTYDITNFISQQLNPPANPTATFPTGLLLTPSASIGDESLSRLVVNDQTLGTGIMLKLYVLGL